MELIIDFTIQELLRNPERKFTQVEMGFWNLWWRDQTEEMKADVRMLIQEGRLEFVNAGWSMNDEACPYYADIIDNMKSGHDYLFKELGIKPRIGWHLDPFGHSTANQALFADMGMEAMFVGRLDFEDKQKRLEDLTMEFIWEPFSKDRGETQQIFFHNMYDHYYPPPGFSWCTNNCPMYDEPIVDNPNLKTYNVDE